MTADTVLQSAALVLLLTGAFALLVLLLDRTLPRRYVQERHDLAVAAFFLAPLVFIFGLRAAPAIPSDSISATSATVAQNSVNRGDLLPQPAAEIIEAAPPLLSLPLGTVLLSLWLAGSAALLLRICFELAAVLRLKSRAQTTHAPWVASLSRPVPVKLSSEVTSPMLVGYLRPAILLPLADGDSRFSRAVLEHEVAHARRGDVWTTLALRIVEAVFWWALPLRLLKPVIDRSREMLCDSYAAKVTNAPVELARELLDAAARTRQPIAPALAAGAHGAALPARVRRLTRVETWQPRTTWARLSTVLPMLVLATWALTPRLGEAQAANPYGDSFSVARYGDDAQTDLPLYKAAARGDLDKVTRLVASGANPSAVSIGDGTALMAAVQRRHDDIVDFLLAAGADPNTVAPGDGTALLEAVRRGHAAMVEQLLNYGANPDLAVPGDGSPMIVAAHRGRVDMIDLLLAAGGDPNVASPRDGNPLIAAALAGEVESAKRLLQAGADPNGYVYRDETPLINAAQQGHLDVLNVLIEAGADVSLTVATPHHDPGGTYRSPLSEAERRGHDNVVRRLRELGAEHREPASE